MASARRLRERQQTATTPNASALYGNTSQQVVGGTRVNYQGVIARGGINYHFNFGGFAPIVAKYRRKRSNPVYAK